MATLGIGGGVRRSVVASPSASCGRGSRAPRGRSTTGRIDRAWLGRARSEPGGDRGRRTSRAATTTSCGLRRRRGRSLGRLDARGRTARPRAVNPGRQMDEPDDGRRLLRPAARSTGRSVGGRRPASHRFRCIEATKPVRWSPHGGGVGHHRHRVDQLAREPADGHVQLDCSAKARLGDARLGAQRSSVGPHGITGSRPSVRAWSSTPMTSLPHDGSERAAGRLRARHAPGSASARRPTSAAARRASSAGDEAGLDLPGETILVAWAPSPDPGAIPSATTARPDGSEAAGALEAVRAARAVRADRRHPGGERAGVAEEAARARRSVTLPVHAVGAGGLAEDLAAVEHLEAAASCPRAR